MKPNSTKTTHSLFLLVLLLSVAPIECFAFPERPLNMNRARALAKSIDASIDDLAAELGAPKSKPAPTPTLRRRLSLFMRGQIPDLDEKKKFRGALKADRQVESYIESAEFSAHWSNVLVRRWFGRADRANQVRLRRWISGSIQTDARIMPIIRRILQGSAGNKPRNPGNDYFESRFREVPERAARATRAFMGIQLQCAQCHDHPFADWKQRQFHEFAAYFSSTEYRYKLKDESSNTTFAPKFPIDIEIRADNKAFDTEPRSAQVATLVTSPDNLFAYKAVANTIWFEAFGWALVEPIDDLQSGSNKHFESLLLKLAQELIAADSDIRTLIAGIALSRFFQLSSIIEPAKSAKKAEANITEDRDHKQLLQRLSSYQSHALSPEQLLDSLITISGEKQGLRRGSKKQQKLAKIRYEAKVKRLRLEFEQLFQNPLASDQDTGSIQQSLIFMNGPAFADFIDGRQNSALATLIKKHKRPKRLVKEIFLLALSRSPTKAELKQFTPFFTDKSEQIQVAEDLLWALINSAEFQFQH